MKKIITHAVCLLFMCITLNSYAQLECGTDVLHNKLMQTDTEYRAKSLAIEAQIKSIILEQNNHQERMSTAQLPIYTIPVVVHVIHLGEPIGTGTNISDAQIQAAIAGLNSRLRNIVGDGVDLEIQFCLASRSPTGTATTGINRVNGSVVPGYATYGIGDYCATAPTRATMADLSRWPVADYYNIWVVNQVLTSNCSSVYAGYASFPWGGVYDGTVIRANSMTNGDSTLAHETGHAYYLYHTFEGDASNTSCPINISCLNDGDKVCDTPPHKQSDCGNANPCTATGVWENSRFNYMSYCFPPIANGGYTQGQKDRVRAAATVYPRLSLLSSLGCTSPILGVNDDSFKSSIVVFPNPSKGVFTIYADEISGAKNIVVYSVLGQKIVSKAITAYESSIDLSGQPKGIYFYKITSLNNEVKSGKLIVE